MTVVDTDILRVVAQMLWTDGNINQNVYNCIVSGGAGPYVDQDVADDMEDWLDNLYANLTTSISDEVDGNSVTVYKYDGIGDDWDEVASQAWIWNPSNVSDELPRANAALVRLWTTDPDVQGKKYLGGLTEGDIIEGLVAASTLSQMLLFAADWFTPFVGSATGATFTPGIWSVVSKAFLAAVDHIAVNGIVAYQRRRKRNIGI